MVIVPDTDIILLKSPLKLDNYNQITFNSATDQYNYFYNLPKLEYEDCTYLRKEGVIRYATNDLLRFEDLLQYNYCMYKNESYSNKWFYAFITDIKYINDGMSEISIETDTFQTWQFDIIYKNSFIEREHVADDTVGLHTIPEGLETGDYIINNAYNMSTKLSTCFTIVAVTWTPDNTPFANYDNRTYNGIYSGTWLLAFRNEDDVTRFIKCYDKMGRGDAITNIYMCPMHATGIPLDDESVWLTYTYSGISTEFAIVPYSRAIQDIDSNITVSLQQTLNGYTPRNNKLKVFPYSYLSISNNNGTQVDFHYEDFINNTPTFDIACCVTAGAQNTLIPRNYKLFNQSTAQYDVFYNYGVAGGKYPTCSWNTDPYTNWLTQNGVNILGKTIDAPTSMALGGTLQALLGAGTIGSVGAESGSKILGTGTEQIGSGLAKMFGSVQEMWKHSLQSPTLEGQTSNGNFSFGWNASNYSYYKMSIKQEYAKIIDSWFDMYGYKVNEVKTPTIHKRSNWDYIKTINVNLEGNIPEKDLAKIRNLFDNGITFWHTTDYFLDYTKTNSIL